MDDKTILLIANIISLAGNVIATTAALLRSKRKVLLFQSTNNLLAGVSEVMLKAYSGVVQEAISIIRNVLFLFVKEKRRAKTAVGVLCLVAGVVAGVLFNVWLSGNVWYGYFPIVGTAVYALFVLLAFLLKVPERKGELLLKVGLLVNAICYACYGIFLNLYPVLIFNSVAAVFSVISIVRCLQKKPLSKAASAAPDGQSTPDAGVSTAKPTSPRNEENSAPSLPPDDLL